MGIEEGRKRTEERTLLRVMDVAFSAATILLAALLIVQCAAIYTTGVSAANMTDAGVRLQDIYSREIVAARFAQIAWAFYLWAALFAAQLVSRALCPRPQGAAAALPIENRVRLTRNRVSSTPEMTREAKKRRIAMVACAAVCAACAGAVAAYLIDPANFASRDLEPVMGEMLRRITPWIALAFLALIADAEFSRRSMLREMEAAKSAPRREAEPVAHRRQSIVPIVRIAAYVAAAALLIAGVKNGGMYDVLVKAINICTECIGLG